MKPLLSRPINRSNRQPKPRLWLIALLLIAVVAGSGLLVTYFFIASDNEASLNTALPILNDLNNTVTQVKESTPITGLTVTFRSAMPVFYVSNNAVNYTFGNVEVSNIDAPYYPSTASISFSVTKVTHTGSSNVVYSKQFPTQNMNLTRGVTIIDAPLGISSISITNAIQGETIVFYLHINVRIVWTTMGIVVATGQTNGTQVLQVSNGGDTATPVTFYPTRVNTTYTGQNVQFSTSVQSQYQLTHFYYSTNITGKMENLSIMNYTSNPIVSSAVWSNIANDTVSVTLTVQDAFGNYWNSPKTNFIIVDKPVINATATPTPTTQFILQMLRSNR